MHQKNTPEEINKYHIITKYANDVITIIELISTKTYQTALHFVIEEFKIAKYTEIPYIHGRIIQWDIDLDSLEDDVTQYLKNEFKSVCPHNFLDRVTDNIKAYFHDYGLAEIFRIKIVEQILFYYHLSKRDFTKKAEKTIDLFTIVTKNKLHPNFQNLLYPRYKNVREVLESWAEGFIDRDKKFTLQFQETFNSMFWELYLYQCLRVLKMDIDFSKQSPDFIVTSPYGNKFCIEAVITNGLKGDKYPYEKDTTLPVEEKINFASIRILNSISNKYKKFMTQYSKADYVKNKPFIIAIAPYEQATAFTQNNQAINLVLYGQIIKTTIDMTGKVLAELFYVDKIQKNKDAQLEVGLFTTDKYKEISAIIFSTTGTFSKAVSCSDADCTIQVNTFHAEKGRISREFPNEMYFESLLDGLQIHRNPFAEVPLDLKEFSNYEISSYTYNPEEKVIMVHQNNNTLVSRISKFLM